MGLDSSAVLFLCAAKSFGVDFTRALTIGRQSLFPSDAALGRVFTVLGIREDVNRFLAENDFGERFFSLLGAREVASMDFSSYESASIIHDLNDPIPDGLRNRYSVVYDGGTLEHVFNVYQALKNAMEMVEPGGHFLQASVANNFMGHGFWQFSPEMLFRAFSADSGYRVEAMLLHERTPGGEWYLVSDPDEVRSRVELCNSLPTYVLTIAKRVRAAEIFSRPPQQSDYASLWSGSSHGRPPPVLEGRERPRPKLRLRWHRRVLRPVESLVKYVAAGRAPKCNGPFDRPCYRRISEESLLRGNLASAQK
jgi:hypothetical protein